MPMPMHMHDKATQATPVGVICSGRPPCYHNAPVYRGGLLHGLVTLYGLVLLYGRVAVIEIFAQLSTVTPPSIILCVLQGLTGILLQQGWYNKGRVQ